MKKRQLTMIAALLVVCSAAFAGNDLYVAGIKVNTEVAGYITGDGIKSGTVYFDPMDHSDYVGLPCLTLDNAVIETTADNQYGIRCGINMKVKVKGTCTINSTNASGIYFNGGSLHLMGLDNSGTLNITSGKSAIYHHGRFLNIEYSLTLEARGQNGIYTEGAYPELRIKTGASLICHGNNRTMSYLYNFTIENYAKTVKLIGNGINSTLRKVDTFEMDDRSHEFDNERLWFNKDLKTVVETTSDSGFKGTILIRRGVEVNETNFPDANFLKCVEYLEGADDKKLTRKEIAKITELNVAGMKIESLQGIEHFTALRKLHCQNNKLTKLDVSKNTNLNELYCYYNEIKPSDMLDLVLSLPENNYVNRTFCVYSTSPYDQNVCTTNHVRGATAKRWKTYYMNIEKNELVEYEGSHPVVVDEINFPDENFRNYVLETIEGKDGYLTENEIANVRFVDLSGKNIASLKGIEHFTELTELRCNYNRLSSLDLSKNTKLMLLHCYDNQLEKLDLTNNKVLCQLDITGNGIKGTDMDDLISSLPRNSSNSYCILYVFDKIHKPGEEGGNVMTTFQVNDAKAKGWAPLNGSVLYEGSEVTGLAIDESRFPDENFRNFLLEQNYGKDGLLSEEEISQITELRVNGKSITSLKGLEYFTALTLLDISINQIGEIEMEHVVRCLEKLEHGGTFYASFYGDSNWLNVYQAARAKNCGWQPMQDIQVMIAVNAPTWQPWSGLPLNQIAFYLEFFNITDENLIDYLMSCDWAREGYVTHETLNTITSLNISNKGLTELGPLVHLTNLQELSCWGNQFETLPLSSFTKLEKLFCQNNKLKELDLSKNTNLKTLSCNTNEIETLDLSNNTELESLSCMSNKLKTLNVSNCPKLQSIWCSSNEIETLDLSNNTALTMLFCRNNQLTSLDLSNTPMLYWLECDNNKLETLDLTGTNVSIVKCANNNISLDNMAALIGSLPNMRPTDDDPSDDNPAGGGSADDDLFGPSPSGPNDPALTRQKDDESFTSSGYLYVYDETSNDRNVCTAELVNTANDKGWEVYYSVDDKYYLYEGSYGVAINEKYFPDSQFRKIVKGANYDKNQNGFLTENEIEEVTILNVLFQEISDLTGIEYFTEITELNCCDNFLTKLDLSKNTKLNKVDCWGNMIKGDEMDALIASLPRTVNGELYVCSESAERDNEITDVQVLEAKRKGWNVLCFNGTDWTDYQGIVTGIGDVSHLNDKGNGDCKSPITYNLNGQRLASPRKGLNIIGGRKVVIK